jgi:hypothetical protein
MKKLLIAGIVGTLMAFAAGSGVAKADNWNHGRRHDDCRHDRYDYRYRPVYRPAYAPPVVYSRPYVYDTYRPYYGTGVYLGNSRFSFGLWR